MLHVKVCERCNGCGTIGFCGTRKCPDCEGNGLARPNSKRHAPPKGSGTPPQGPPNELVSKSGTVIPKEQ